MIEHSSTDARSRRSLRRLGSRREAPLEPHRPAPHRWQRIAATTLILSFAAAGSIGAVVADAATTAPPTNPSATTTPAPTLNSASDQSALSAYRKYLQALVANAQLGRQRDAALVSVVAGSCQNALSQLDGEPGTPMRQLVLANFGEEIGGDLALAFLSEATRPFAQMSLVLGSLRWSSAAPITAIRQLLASERRVLNLPQSNLCADAAQVESSPRVIPSSTLSFMKRYLDASALVSRRFHACLAVLQRYETAAERPLVASIDSLVTQFSSASTSAVQTYSQSLLLDLGLVA